MLLAPRIGIHFIIHIGVASMSLPSSKLRLDSATETNLPFDVTKQNSYSLGGVDGFF
jgi:hypothetical protein